jgi:glycerol-1-phosphate dehydrogenase [NAD(P)+]
MSPHGHPLDVALGDMTPAATRETGAPAPGTARLPVGQDALSVTRQATRIAQVPSALRLVHSHTEALRALVDVVERLAVRRPLFVFGKEGRELIGRSLVIDCHAHVDCDGIELSGASMQEVARVTEVVGAGGHDAVIGCGGGQTLDGAKYGAFQAAVPFVSVPTQATHDGICSPVAVLRDGEDERVDSYGALPPSALVVPIHVVARAPRRTIVTGMADLAANLIALEDWLWARDVKGEEFDDYAALLARSAAHLVVSRRHLFSPDRDFSQEDVEGLVHGLVLSGLAMTLAGSSRPCSGPEHLVSHAFDSLRLGNGAHGEQVAVGSVVAAQLYETDLSPVIELLRAIGAPLRPADIGIEPEDALRAVDMARLVRPGRHTRLSSALAADPDFVHELARSTWLLDDDQPAAPAAA